MTKAAVISPKCEEPTISSELVVPFSNRHFPSRREERAVQGREEERQKQNAGEKSEFYKYNIMSDERRTTSVNVYNCT